MKIKLPLLTFAAVGLFALGAQAVNLKAVIFTADEIVELIKRGKASASSLVDAQFYRGGTTKHALLKTVQRAGKADMHILISREKGEGMDVLKIHLASPLDESVKTSIDDLPATYMMHGSIGDVGEQALINSGLKEEGLKIMGNIVNARLATISEERIYHVIEKMKSLKASGMNVQPSGNVIMDQTLSRHNFSGVLQSLDLRYVPSLRNSGPAAAFEIRLGITENTTPEQLRRILEVIAKSGDVAF